MSKHKTTHIVFIKETNGDNDWGYIFHSDDIELIEKLVADCKTEDKEQGDSNEYIIKWVKLPA